MGCEAELSQNLTLRSTWAVIHQRNIHKGKWTLVLTISWECFNVQIREVTKQRPGADGDVVPSHAVSAVFC